MSIRGILFDFDGTIADSARIVIDSWQHTFRTIRGEECDLETLTATFGEKLEITMKRFFPDFDTDEALEIYRNYQSGLADEAWSLFPGIRELLMQLKEQGYKVGIVTSRTGETTRRALKRLDVEKYIDGLVTCDDTDKHKPDPEPALLGLASCGLAAHEALFVGDTTYDMGCARNAGILTVFVTWSVSATPETLKGEYEPDYIIESAEELMNLLKRIEES